MKTHRLYSFVNQNYMRPIQFGIQSAHCVSTMMASAFRDAAASSAGKARLDAVMEWAEGGPTMMVMGLDNVAQLLAHEERLKGICAQLGLPFSVFREDQQSLGGIITAVAVLVPEELFNVAAIEQADGSRAYAPLDEEGLGMLDRMFTAKANPIEHALLETIKGASFAR